MSPAASMVAKIRRTPGGAGQPLIANYPATIPAGAPGGSGWCAMASGYSYRSASAGMTREAWRAGNHAMRSAATTAATSVATIVTHGTMKA